MISIIIPVLNEAKTLVEFLQPLQKYRQLGVEIIVIDGGSVDNTMQLAMPLCDVVVASDKGRARQMNSGAGLANGDVYLFLHADTLLPENFIQLIEESLANYCSVWGRFNICLSGSGASLRMVEFFVNFRSRWTGIATGDQAIFVKADVFHQFNGYENIPLMEDVAFSKMLKKLTPPICLKEKVTTSSRRWEKGGVWRTIFLMWQLRMAYYFGADPHRLASKYE